jgi:hypothetical protein
VFWLVGWSLGGAVVAFTVLWALFGRERLVLKPDALVVRREVLGIGRGRIYDIRHVKDLRVAAAGAFDYRRSLEIWGVGGGRIALITEPRPCTALPRSTRRRRSRSSLDCKHATIVWHLRVRPLATLIFTGTFQGWSQ